MASYSGQGFGSNVKFNLIAELRLEHPAGGKTDSAMSARIGGIWSCLCREGNPIWVWIGLGIVVSSSQLYCAHGSPQIVGVLCVEECDHGVCDADVHQGKQVGTLRQTQVMFQGCGLSNFIPEILNVPIPEFPNFGLFRSASCTRYKSQTFHLIERLDIGIACQFWRGRRAKLACRGDCKGSHEIG